LNLPGRTMPISQRRHAVWCMRISIRPTSPATVDTWHLHATTIASVNNSFMSRAAGADIYLFALDLMEAYIAAIRLGIADIWYTRKL